MATQSIDWQSNNVVLVHYAEKGGIIELQRVTTATEVEPIENSLRGSRSLPSYACYSLHSWRSSVGERARERELREIP